MSKHNASIYSMARIAARMTQDYAAEELAIGRRTLAEYETGNTTVPDDVAAKMMSVYQAPWLGYKHLRLTKVGAALLPVIECNKGIAACAVSSEVAAKKLLAAMGEFMMIAADDKVDGMETARFNVLKTKMAEVVAALMEVCLFSRHKKITADVAHRQLSKTGFTGGTPNKPNLL